MPRRIVDAAAEIREFPPEAEPLNTDFPVTGGEYRIFYKRTGARQTYLLKTARDHLVMVDIPPPRQSLAFFTNCDFSPIWPMPGTLQSMS